MSAHNAKKKRMGSRRKAVNQNEIDEGTERPLTDTSPAEYCTSAKTSEETEEVNNPDRLTAVPLNWPSPELKESKRKFGSRRKQKGLHAGGVATVLHSKEDGEEATDNSKLTETIQVSMEIQTPNSPDLSQESETFVDADIHLCESNPHCDSSELKDSSGRRFLGTDEDCSHASSENQTQDNTEKYSSQSEEIWMNSPDKSGLSMSETLEENMQPFMISVESDLTREPKHTDMPEELSEKAGEERKNESELLRQTEDFQPLRFQSDSPKEDDSWLQINVDLAVSGKQNETFPPNEGSLEDEQNEHLDMQVDDNLISVDSVDRIHVQHDDSIENHEIKHTFESDTHDVTGRPTGEIGPSVKERIFGEVEQINISPEAKQNLFLAVSDYDHRFTENTMAKTNNDEAIATTTVSSEIEDSVKPTLKEIDPILTEKSNDEIKDSIQTVICDDVPEHFSTDLIMEGMQIDQSHFRDGLEKSRTDVSINKEEEVNCENKQDGYQAEGMALGAHHQTSEEFNLNETKNTWVAGMDRAHTEPGGVYQTEVEEDNEIESKGLDSDVQVDLDLPPTQLEQIESVSSPVICRRKLGSSRKKKLKDNAQDTDLSQHPAEEATGHSDDHEPLQSTVSLASVTEVTDQVEETEHGVTHGDRGFSWSADSYVSVDEMEKLPVDESLVQQSSSSITSSSVVDRENMDPTLAENPSDQVRESMQTDILDDASEYFSTDLTMGAMQMDHTHFTDMLEEFSNVHSEGETHSNKDSELLKDDHSASASPPISVNISITSEIDGSTDLEVTEYSIENTIVDLTEEHSPFVDGNNDYQLGDANGSNALSKTNCPEADSKTGGPNSENHQESVGGEDDVQGDESAGTLLDDWEKCPSHTGDLSSHRHSENSPINFDEEGTKASHMHDVSCSLENEINDTCMSQFGSKTRTDVSLSKDEELNYESKQEEDPTEENDFGTFPQTRQVSRRKLGSSRKKKLKDNAQDTDLSQHTAEEATGHSDDHEPLQSTVSLASVTEVTDEVEETEHGVTHSDRGFSWSADSYVSVDETEKLPVDDSLAQQSDSSLTSSSVADRENMDPTLAENQSDQVKESMQTDILDDASEYFSTDLTMGAMQMDHTHFTDMLEEFSNVSNEENDFGTFPQTRQVSRRKLGSSRKKKLKDNAQDTDLSQHTAEEATGHSDDHEPLQSTVSLASVTEVTDEVEETEQGVTHGDRGFSWSADSYVSVDEMEKLPVDDSLVQQSDSSLTSSSVVDRENVDPTLAENQSDQVKESMQTDILDDASEYFSTDLTMGAMQMDHTHFTDMLEEFSNVSNEENDFGTFPQTRQVSRRKLGSSRKKKLNHNAQDTALSQPPAEKATGHSDDEPLDSTMPDTEVSDQVEETAHGVTNSNIPELDASDVLSSPTPNQQSAEEIQGLLSVFSATERKEQGEDSDSFGPDQNRHLLASESEMQSPYEEAFNVLMITTEQNKYSSDPSTLPEEDKDNVNQPESSGLHLSVESYGNVDEEADKLPVDDSLLLQSDSVLQSVIDGESRGSEPGEEMLSSNKTVINMNIEESSNAQDEDIGNTRYESVNTDSIQAVEADSHPPIEESFEPNTTINQALEEFAREVGPSVNMQVSGKDEIVENTADLTKKTSAQEENKELDPFGVQENSGKEPTTDVPQEVEQSRAEGAYSPQQVHLQTQTKQKRRKMGSTRRANFTRQQDKEMCTDNETKRTPADQNDFEKVEADHRLSCIITDVSHGGNLEEPNNSRQRNTETNVSTAVVEVDVNSVALDKVEDLRYSERNSDAVMEELKPDGLIAAETVSSLNPGHPTNTEWSSESVDGVTQGTQDDEGRLDSVLSDQLLESAAKLIVTTNLEKVKSELRRGDEESPNDVSEEVKVDEDLETRSASLSLKSDTKRRKMGSTRKSLASRRAGLKDEGLSGKQGEDGEATNVQVTDSGASKTEDNKLTPESVIVLETVERRSTTVSYSRPPATTEEAQFGHSLAVSTAPQPDAMPETAAGGRRRKMGSHRKSHGYQRNRDLVVGQEETGDSHPEASSSSLTSDMVTKTAEEKSPSLENIPEDKDENKTPSNTITARAAEQPKPLHENISTQETAAQQPSTNRPGSARSPNTLSIAEHSSEETLPSKSYNVILIGDSSVGKTSFMKRVQTGKFSLDIPASVGTDSCISSVLVDGKRVALQLWDTAGQERFHSITRQIFHKAQAFLLMYDITSSKSFSDISYWATCIQESASDDVTIVLLGNKSDSATRQVQHCDGEALAKEYNFEFMECSVATGHNVTHSLETVARVLSEKCDTREEAMLLRQEPQKKKSSGCC